MDSVYIIPLLSYLQSLSGEVVSIYLFALSIVCILLLFRFFSLEGLLAYNVIATITGNIQVLKLANFGLSPEPVALGTVTFATIFFVSDIITEHYGKEAAKRNVWLCFFSQIIVMGIMIFSLGHAPLLQDVGHQAMEVLFIPSPRLVVASLTAFVISLLLEITIFNSLSRLTHTKHLWLRTSVSSIVAAFLDNIIFSCLAWVVLSPHPVSWRSLLFTYILGTYLARLCIALLATPLLYLSYYFKPKKHLEL